MPLIFRMNKLSWSEVKCSRIHSAEAEPGIKPSSFRHKPSIASLPQRLPNSRNSDAPVYQVTTYMSRRNRGWHCPGLQAPFSTHSHIITTTLIS